METRHDVINVVRLSRVLYKKLIVSKMLGDFLNYILIVPLRIIRTDITHNYEYLFNLIGKFKMSVN